MPEHRSIGELAYQLWLSRGCPEGTAEQDWLDAERELLALQSTTAVESTARPAKPETVDESLEGTFPASDPPASRAPDQPPSNADAKWKAAAASKKSPAGSRTGRKSSSSPGGGKSPGGPNKDATH
ncbi:MAG TPA: DUF2934 domain-containing protein [Steroidobacteraceae bacterium]|jgi:hypothetical protein|nr:DUF2934 domain-containing protein [Steroidobacteraceae bacterium]